MQVQLQLVTAVHHQQLVELDTIEPQPREDRRPAGAERQRLATGSRQGLCHRRTFVGSYGDDGDAGGPVWSQEPHAVVSAKRRRPWCTRSGTCSGCSRPCCRYSSALPPVSTTVTGSPALRCRSATSRSIAPHQPI